MDRFTWTAAVPITDGGHTLRPAAAVLPARRWTRRHGTGYRVSVGALNVIWRDPEIAMEVEYAPSAEHKGDFFTKELGAAMFKEARERVGMRSGMVVGSAEAEPN